MRDDEQHWFNEVGEQLLYLHAPAGTALFDDLLQRVVGEHLANHLPSRVLPLSVDPPRDLAVLFDEEYSQIARLLAPGRRASHEARARIRTLLAMEAHVEAEARVSSRDVDRVEKGIKACQTRSGVFPRLRRSLCEPGATGVNLTVHFTKKEAAPVRFVSDETSPAAAVREVDLARKFYLSASGLASKVGLSGSRRTALRRHLGIDTDAGSCHIFVFDSQRIARFSDNAYRPMTRAIAQLDMAAVWDGHKPVGRRSTPRSCAVEGCAA